jgi:hypothetical protein
MQLFRANRLLVIDEREVGSRTSVLEVFRGIEIPPCSLCSRVGMTNIRDACSLRWPVGMTSAMSLRNVSSCSGVEVIEHDVNHDARDRNVKPEWKCPARDAAMGREAGLQRAVCSDEYERNDGGGENRV